MLWFTGLQGLAYLNNTFVLIFQITKQEINMNNLNQLYYYFYSLKNNYEKYNFILNNVSNTEFKINWSNLLIIYK